MPKAARTARTVRVDPIYGEPLRYRVESWARPQFPHIVDLSMNKGNGSCSCTDFTTRRQPAIKAGGSLFTRATSCRHVMMARKFFTIATLTEMAVRLHPEGVEESP
jgi:hypothetical protein